MPRHIWKSLGRKIEPEFVEWIQTTPKIIIPSFYDVIFPPLQFAQSTLVTLDWEKNTFHYNVSKTVFPNLKKVELVGYTSLVSRVSAVIDIQKTPEETYIRNGQVRWKSHEWVNREWLTSQFNELFARYLEVVQNELRRELK